MKRYIGVYRKNVVYIGFGTVRGFKHPLGVLESWNISPGDKGQGGHCTPFVNRQILLIYLSEPAVLVGPGGGPCRRPCPGGWQAPGGGP